MNTPHLPRSTSTRSTSTRPTSTLILAALAALFVFTADLPTAQADPFYCQSPSKQSPSKQAPEGANNELVADQTTRKTYDFGAGKKLVVEHCYSFDHHAYYQFRVNLVLLRDGHEPLEKTVYAGMVTDEAPMEVFVDAENQRFEVGYGCGSVYDDTFEACRDVWKWSEQDDAFVQTIDGEVVGLGEEC